MRRVMRLLTVVGLAGAAALVIPGTAGAGKPEEVGAPVTIEKVAVDAPAGTKFTIRLECDTTAIVSPGGYLVDTLDFTFTVNDKGEAVPDGTNTVEFGNEAGCTVTETVAGGAESTSYECADNLKTLEQGTETGDGFAAEDPNAEAIAPTRQFCLTFGPQADPISFAVVSSRQEVTVTVTNTFPKAPVAPPAPVPVEVPVITFTG